MTASPLAAAVRRSTRVVAVQPWMVTELGIAAVWFSQLLWRMEVAGSDTVVAADHSWQTDAGLSRGQALRARQKVEQRGWITSEVRKVDGAPTCRITLDSVALDADYRAIHRAESDDPGESDPARTSTSQMVEENPTTPDSAKGALFDAPEPTPGPVGFDDFWSVYPADKGSKSAARAKWPAAVKKVRGDGRVLVDAAQAYAEVRRRQDPQYTVRASTWLNQGRWADDLPEPDRGRDRGIDTDRTRASGLLSPDEY